MLTPYQFAQVSFRKTKEIGQEGRNSKVYLAHDKYLDAEIVVKEIAVKDRGALNDYLSEARTLYKSSHPHVAQVNYTCMDDKNIYIASPYYKNGSLKKKMAKRMLTGKEIIRYSVHMLSGLHNIHSKGLIHFDLKPDNLLLSDRDEALVADFGLAKVMDNTGMAEQPRLYCKQYPPEVFTLNGNKPNFNNRFDIYQAGLTMYRMCVGDQAFDKQFKQFIKVIGPGKPIFDLDEFGKAVLRGKFPDRKAYPLHIHNKLQKAINKCLEVDPNKRYRSAIEVVNSISDIDSSILTWVYIPSDNGHTWERCEDGKKKVIKITNDGVSEAYTLNGEGAKRKSKAFCKERITDKEIIQYLES